MDAGLRKPRKEKYPKRPTEEQIRRNVQTARCFIPSEKDVTKSEFFVLFIVLSYYFFFSSFLMQGQHFREVVCKQLDNFAVVRMREGKIFSRAMVIFQKALLMIFLIILLQETKQVFVTMAILNSYSSRTRRI